MRTIYKYYLKLDGVQHIEMPKGAKILCVQLQQRSPCLWAEVETTQEMETHIIHTIGTGHEIKEENLGTYIGTYQFADGAVALHLYDQGV